MDPPNKLKEWEEEEKKSKLNSVLAPNADFSGPVTPRYCTDPVCILLFLVSNLALLAFAGYCYYFGEPEKLLHGWDFRGESCGVAGLAHRKYTYFPEPITSLDVSLCLEGCPVTTARNSICFYEPDHSTDVANEPCFTSYPSKPFFNKYCLPADKEARDAVVSWLYDRERVVTRSVGDVARAWDLLIIAGLVPCVFALFFLLWLHVGRGIVILAILSMLALLFGLSSIAFLTYEEAWRTNDRLCTNFHMVTMENCDSDDQTLVYKILSFCIIGIAAIAVLGVIAKIGRVVPGSEFLELAVGPLKSSRWMVAMLVVLMLLGASFYTFFLTLLTYSSSVSSRDTISTTYITGDSLKQLSFTSLPRILILFEFLMFLWWVSLIVHIAEYVTASYTASWFFSKDRNLLSAPIRLAVWNLFRYHFGSVLLASLTIPILRTPRQVMKTVKTALAGMNDKTQHCCASVCGPCFELYEILFKFANSQALPYQAIWGNTFCESAKRGLFLLARGQPQALGAVHSAEFIIWVGQMVVVLSSPVFLYYWVMHIAMTIQGEHTKVVTSVVFLAWVSGIFSWLISEILCGFLRGLMYSEVISYFVDKEMFVGVQRFSDINFSAIFHEEITLTTNVEKKDGEKLFFTEDSQQDLLDELHNGVSSNRPLDRFVLESISSQPSFISDTSSDEGHDFSLRPVTPVKAFTSALSSAQDTARKLAGPVKPNPEPYKKPTMVVTTRRAIAETVNPEMSVSSFADSSDDEALRAPVARPPTRGDVSARKRGAKKKGPRNL